MLFSSPRRPSIRLRGCPALNSRAGPSRISHHTHRTFYSDLYENEGHLFDLHRDEGRPTVTPSPFSSGSRSGTQQSHRFSTSHRSAYEVERQMQRVSLAFLIINHSNVAPKQSPHDRCVREKEEERRGRESPTSEHVSRHDRLVDVSPRETARSDRVWVEPC